MDCCPKDGLLNEQGLVDSKQKLVEVGLRWSNRCYEPFAVLQLATLVNHLGCWKLGPYSWLH